MIEKHSTDIDTTLTERKEQHGPFDTHCEIEDRLRDFITAYDHKLTSIQKIGLGMIMHKIARILNDGQNHKDTWHDIAGYAILIERSMPDE